MTLTDKQNAGLKIAIKRYNNHEKYTCIAGFAGTGKSTLVKYIIAELHIPESAIAYCAYTGKAALRLKELGNPNAMTAHELTYHSKENPDGSYTHVPRKAPENPNLLLVVIDEVSMLEKEQWDILMGWHIHIIAIGDPEQLPPIHESNGVLNHPHIFLDEIVRQAQDNEIINLSMNVREGKPLKYYKGKDVRIIEKCQVGDNLLVSADQVLCGKNVTRYDLNRRIRKVIWGEQFADMPIDGDKIICLKNYWNYGLANGTMGTIKNIIIQETSLFKPQLFADFMVDGFTHEFLHMDAKIFREGVPTVDKNNWMQYPKELRPLTFDFANAITVHKAQGSEFPRVVVYYEWFGDRETMRRWLYTAVTRASEKLVLVM